MFTRMQVPAVDSATEAAEHVHVFEKADSLCDVTFEVENRKLHFWKVLLRLVSPVFDRMFASDFKEKDSTLIPLPGKKVKHVDVFLQNIHPAYTWKHLEDDKTLEVLLRFADEYETEHMRQKCLHYMNQQIKPLEHCRPLTDKAQNKVILYVSLYEQCRLHEIREKLILLASRIRLGDLECHDLFNQLSETCKLDILKERCRLFD